MKNYLLFLKSFILLLIPMIFISCTIVNSPPLPPPQPRFIEGVYDYQNQRLTINWGYGGLGIRFKVYVKFLDSDYVVVAESLQATAVTIELRNDAWNKLEKVAVSSYNNIGESPKAELRKEEIKVINKFSNLFF